MATSQSPKSVLNFIEDERSNNFEYPGIDKSTPVLEDFWAQPINTSRKRRRQSHTGITAVASTEVSKRKATCIRSSSAVINLRHRAVCHETVEWLARGCCRDGSDRESHRSTVQALSIGPVFESSHTLLSAIESLPQSVTSLDLDLRNALDLLPEALSLLFRSHHHARDKIESLSLRFFGDKGAEELSKWIHLKPQLKRLDLRENRISDHGLDNLIYAIVKSGLRLHHLSLSGNCITSVDTLRMLLASNNTSLKTLDLSFTRIGDCELIKLCRDLEGNESLVELNLKGCKRLSHRGLSTLRDVLEWNTTLQRVNFRPMGQAEETAISEVEHLLSLNHAGRSLFREATVPYGLWPTVLARTSSKPCTLFHMLRQILPGLLVDKA